MRNARAVRTAILIAVFSLLATILPATAQPATSGEELVVTVGPGPTTPSGAVAGAATRLVVTFVDRDPAVEGVGIKDGGTIEITLPVEFTYVGTQPGDVAVILQGWPQSPPGPLPEWPWTFEIDGNTVRITLSSDYIPGMFGPGPKQVHLFLNSFQNPTKPGFYPIDVMIQPDPASSETLSGAGKVFIQSAELPKVSAVSLYSGPPGPPPPFYNPIYQTIDKGESARQVGLYLWGRNGVPLTGVSVEQVNSRHARLVQQGRTVGQIWIDGPKGAWDSEIVGFGPSGGPVSEEIAAFGSGVPVGILVIQFTPDPDVTGDYTLRIRLTGGLSETLYVSVV